MSLTVFLVDLVDPNEKSKYPQFENTQTPTLDSLQDVGRSMSNVPGCFSLECGKKNLNSL